MDRDQQRQVVRYQLFVAKLMRVAVIHRAFFCKISLIIVRIEHITLIPSRKTDVQRDSHGLGGNHNQIIVVARRHHVSHYQTFHPSIVHNLVPPQFRLPVSVPL